MFVFFMRAGKLVRQKVALLQSKRLYPTSGDIDYIEEYDYRIGMARLAQRDKDAPSMMAQRSFVFGETSRYGALHAHDNQYEAISEYTKRHLAPVYYLFYNPPTLPLLVQVPLTRRVAVEWDPILGSRVVPFRRITDILGEEKKGYSPTIAELAGRCGCVRTTTGVWSTSWPTSFSAARKGDGLRKPTTMKCERCFSGGPDQSRRPWL